MSGPTSRSPPCQDRRLGADLGADLQPDPLIGAGRAVSSQSAIPTIGRRRLGGRPRRLDPARPPSVPARPAWPRSRRPPRLGARGPRPRARVRWSLLGLVAIGSARPSYYACTRARARPHTHTIAVAQAGRLDCDRRMRAPVARAIGPAPLDPPQQSARMLRPRVRAHPSSGSGSTRIRSRQGRAVSIPPGLRSPGAPSSPPPPPPQAAARRAASRPAGSASRGP